MKSTSTNSIQRHLGGRDHGRSQPAKERNPVVSPIRIWPRRRWVANVESVVIVLALVALPIFSATAANVFTLTNTPLPAVGYSSVVCGDFNNMGKPGVLLAGSDGSFSPTCQVWQDQMSGSFTKVNAALPGLSSSAVAAGDFGNDGRLDLLLTGFAGVDNNNFPVYVSQVWHNLGNGSFTNMSASLPGVDTGAVALGDFDNDGNLDIVLTGYSSTGPIAQVWHNLGNSTFTNLNIALPGVLYSSVALGDYDNDGKLDILLTGTVNGFDNAAITQLWHNLGNNTFTNIITGLPGVTQGAVAWADFNNDGRLDILLTGYTQTGAVCQVWRNLGNGSFTNMNVGLPGVYQSSVAVADYDNDGKLDIVIAGLNIQTQPICEVWRNTGNWVFTNINAGLTGVHSGSVTWADFENDGKLDLLLAGLNASGNPILQVYHNNTVGKKGVVPSINNLQFLDNHSKQVMFRGQSGFGYTVWASTNLRQWAALGIPNQASPGVFQFTDPLSANLDRRYYRISQP